MSCGSSMRTGLLPVKSNPPRSIWKTITFREELSKEEIFAGLDECLVEIQQLEEDLKEKLF